MEGNLRFGIDWASLILGSKLTIFALFYFEFEGYFPSTSPWGAYIAYIVVKTNSKCSMLDVQNSP